MLIARFFSMFVSENKSQLSSSLEPGIQTFASDRKDTKSFFSNVSTIMWTCIVGQETDDDLPKTCPFPEKSWELKRRC